VLLNGTTAAFVELNLNQNYIKIKIIFETI